MKRSWRPMLIACSGLVVTAVTVAVVAFRKPVRADDFISQQGVPLLVAKATRMELWDPERRGLLPAHVLVIEGVRAWDDATDPSPDTVLLYSDDDFVRTYVAIFLANLGVEHGPRTFALGVRTRVVCVEIDSLGLVRRQAVQMVPFVELAPVVKPLRRLDAASH